jgi:hypothetical protein
LPMPFSSVVPGDRDVRRSGSPICLAAWPDESPIARTGPDTDANI